MNSLSSPEGLVERIIAWARDEPNVIAVVLTGSRARLGATIDEFSDYDIEIIAADPRRLTCDQDWFRSFGDLWVCPPLVEDQGDPAYLAIFAEGKVDLSLCGRDRVASMVRSGRLDSLYERGYQVLLDKEGLNPSRLPRNLTGRGHVMRCRHTAVDHAGFDGPISGNDPLREGS